MLQQKIDFLRKEYIPLLQQLQSAQQGKWGKMDAQQMVEHMRDVFKLASGKVVLPLVDPDPERLEQRRNFLASEQPFKENIRLPVMPEEPRAHKYGSMEEAIEKLRPELEAVFAYYAADPERTSHNPVFGDLNYEQQVNLLYKHARHHLRQFGVE
jgi:hypothetical protein